MATKRGIASTRDGTLETKTPIELGRVDATSTPETIPVTARLQILSTEHWSLLATRSLTWNESFSRSSIFLATLSGTVIALALAAQATSFGPGSVGFALVVLPVTFFIGLTTFVRLVAVNREDMLWVQGMNRIRHAYLELAPDLEPYLVAAWNDDEAGVMTTLGAPHGAHGWYHHVLVTTPGVVAVVDAVVGASVAALAAIAYGMSLAFSVAIGVVMFLSVAASLLIYQRRAFTQARALPTVHFRSPPAHCLLAHQQRTGAPHRRTAASRFLQASWGTGSSTNALEFSSECRRSRSIARSTKSLSMS